MYTELDEKTKEMVEEIKEREYVNNYFKRLNIEEQRYLINMHDPYLLNFHALSPKQIFNLSKNILKRRGSKWISLIEDYKKTMSFYKKETNNLKNKMMFAEINLNNELLELQNELEEEKAFFKSKFNNYDYVYVNKYGEFRDILKTLRY